MKTMDKFKSLPWRREKPIIGTIHLQALPGSVHHSQPIQDLISSAKEETKTLVKAGIDGILIENYGDYPYVRTENPSETTAAMTLITSTLKNMFQVPIGINILRNSCTQAMSVASVCEIDFIRCNIFTSAYVTDQGIIQGEARKVLLKRKKLNSNVLVFADIFCKHASPISNRGLLEEAQDAIFRGSADAIIITGHRTGVPPRKEDLIKLKEQNLGPILIGSGLTTENYNELMQFADGAIVGSYFKRNGDISQSVDFERVSSLLNQTLG